jgi:hypothetical protein
VWSFSLSEDVEFLVLVTAKTGSMYKI